MKDASCAAKSARLHKNMRDAATGFFYAAMPDGASQKDGSRFFALRLFQAVKKRVKIQKRGMPL